MDTKYNFELIKDFLDGTLDSNTASQISSLIQNDETARDIAKGILMLKSKFDSDEELEAYLDKSLASHLSLIEDNQQKKSSFRFVKIAAAILLVAVSSFVIYQYSESSVENMLNSELTTIYKAPPTLRDSKPGQDSFLSAVQLYNSGEFVQANQLFKTDESVISTFYSGLCHLYSNEYEEAIIEFSKPQLKESRYTEQSRWYMTIALIKTNELELAKANLQTISEKPNHFKREEAEKIMLRLAE